ncbi:hypothetical protein [Boseongicola sp. H5]|uniref:hypothetical protein n=1 Tax=Rhodobacterales TaxID=204455 RepID=UPI001D0A6FF8|nr:hypothetical protein [Boseongicola sp. H5]
MRPRPHLALAVLALLAACGPMSPERAYQTCSERARAAAGPTGSIGVGVGSGGPTARLEVGITSDYLAGRDPQLVYDRCFRQLTGAGPTRPLIL